MKLIRMPGFSGEDSFYRSSAHYRSGTTFAGGRQGPGVLPSARQMEESEPISGCIGDICCAIGPRAICCTSPRVACCCWFWGCGCEPIGNRESAELTQVFDQLHRLA